MQCSKCFVRVQPGDNFCARCGTKFKQQVQLSGNFCARCGAQFNHKDIMVEAEQHYWQSSHPSRPGPDIRGYNVDQEHYTVLPPIHSSQVNNASRYSVHHRSYIQPPRQSGPVPDTGRQNVDQHNYRQRPHQSSSVPNTSRFLDQHDFRQPPHHQSGPGPDTGRYNVGHHNYWQPPQQSPQSTPETSRVHRERQRQSKPSYPSQLSPDTSRFHGERQRHRQPSFPPQLSPETSRVQREQQRQSQPSSPPQPSPDTSSFHGERQRHRQPSFPPQLAPETSRVQREQQRQSQPSSPPQPSPDTSSFHGERQRHSQSVDTQDSPSLHPSQTVPDDGRPSEEHEQKVHCKSKIQHDDIAKFIRKYNDSLTDKDRTMLQGAMDLVTEESNYVWENAQLTVHCSTMKAVFHSGNPSNQYVLYLNVDDRPATAVVKREVRRTLQGGATAVFAILKQVVTVMAKVTP